MLFRSDFADVRNVMKNKGTALMGIGIASGQNRAIEAARKAIRSPLLEIDINGATDAIVFITSDVDISMHEVVEVMTEIQNASTSEIDLVCGTGFNMDLQGELIVTVIATGFDQDTDAIRALENEFTTGFPQYVPQQPKPNSAPDLVAAEMEASVEVPAEPKQEREKGDSTLPAWLKNRFK